MKSLILATFLVIPSVTSAQVVTTPPFLPVKDSVGTRALVKALAILYEHEKECRSLSKHKLEQPTTLETIRSQIVLEKVLPMLQGRKRLEFHCEKILTPYENCVFSNSVKTEMHAVVTVHPKVFNEYAVKTYGMKESEAEELRKFYEEECADYKPPMR